MKFLAKHYFKVLLALIISLIIAIVLIIVTEKQEKGFVILPADIILFIIAVSDFTYIIYFYFYRYENFLLLTKVTRKDLVILKLIMVTIPLIFGGILALTAVIKGDNIMAFNLIFMAAIYTSVLALASLSMKLSTTILIYLFFGGDFVILFIALNLSDYDPKYNYIRNILIFGLAALSLITTYVKSLLGFRKEKLTNMKRVIDLFEPLPIHEQISEQMKSLIIKGELMPTEPIPSIKALAKELKISEITIQEAYEDLEKTGYIIPQPGKSYLVNEVDSKAIQKLAINNLTTKMENLLELAKAYNIPQEQLTDIIKKA